MKIGIPSEDGKTINAHFGRTKAFVVVTINGTEYKKSIIPNTFTGHASGHNHAEHQHDHHGHSHNNIHTALGMCDVIIAGGMGPRLLADFTNWGKKVYLTRERNVDKVVQDFISGELEHNPDVTCHH